MIEDISKIDPEIHAPTPEQLAFLEQAFLSPTRPPKRFRRRSEISTQELSSEVTTLGWDTTYVLRTSDVNAVLEKSQAVPKTFDITVDPQENYKASGSFGPWQIGLGGSGGIVFLAIPITTGTMTSGEKEYSMNGAIAYISVKLKYIPQLPKQNQQTRTATHIAGIELVNQIAETDDLKTDTSDRSPTDPAVVVQNLVFLDQPPATFIRALMIGALQEWFTANLVQFAYIFATVNLNQKAADLEFQWLQPTYTGYAYFDGVTEEEAYFSILNMTDGRSPDGLSHQIAPRSIPTGSRAGFNISMQRYMEKVIFPGLVKGFPHATSSSFTLKNNNTIIDNTENIECDKVRVGLIDYTPVINDFILQVVGNEIQIYTKTITQISPGIRSVVENTSYQTIVVVNKPDGSQTLDFKETQPARTSSYVDKDSWITITELIISIAGAIAGIVAGVVIKGAAKIIMACVIIGIVFALAAATPELIAAVAGGGAAAALPPIDLMVLNATAPVRWPGSAEFTLDSALLNGAFQLGGNPHIAPAA